MRAMLIDPHKREVTELDVDRGIDAIYTAIDATCFDRAKLCTGIDMWVDDEGLFRKDQAFFSIISIGQLMAGKALVLASDRQGESVGLPDYVEAEDLKHMIHWYDTPEDAEIAIKCKLVDRPYCAINGVKSWEWTADQVNKYFSE